MADDFDTDRMSRIIVKSMDFKRALKARSLTRGKAKCPFCESGHWHGTLNGHRQHLHMHCDGCSVQLME